MKHISKDSGAIWKTCGNSMALYSNADEGKESTKQHQVAGQRWNGEEDGGRWEGVRQEEWGRISQGGLHCILSFFLGLEAH